jgi:hypothetical protein
MHANPFVSVYALAGKTAAFVLPMLAYIMRQPLMNEENEADGPYAVVGLLLRAALRKTIAEHS